MFLKWLNNFFFMKKKLFLIRMKWYFPNWKLFRILIRYLDIHEAITWCLFGFIIFDILIYFPSTISHEGNKAYLQVKVNPAF